MAPLSGARKGFRLHTKFIVLLTSVSLVPLLIVSLVTLDRFQETLDEDTARFGHQLAATASAEIKAFMISQLRILDNVAAIYQPEFPIEPDVAEGILENIMFRSENFSDISVVDVTGKEIARKNRLLVVTHSDFRDWSDREAFAQVREHGIYAGPVLIERGRPFFNLGVQILNTRGEFSGAVFAEVDARVMPRVVAEISDIVGKPGRVYIVNDKGVVIAHPDLSYVLGEKDLSSLPTVQRVITGDIRSGTRVVSERYVNEEGQEVLGSAHPMTIGLFEESARAAPQVSWYVIAEQPVDVVYEGAREAGIFSLIISLAAIILAAITAVFFAGRIARPVELLHEAAQEFGKGNLEYRAPVERGDELGDLGKSFNTMAGTIAETLRSLKREEEVVAAERNKLGMILAGITNAVVAVDLEGRIVLFNKAAEALTGRASSEVIGKPVKEIFVLHDGQKEVPAEEYCPKTAAAVDGPVYTKNELRMNDVSGKEHVVNLVSGRIKEGKNIDLGCILTFQDITREFVMDRTKREFVSIAAHQLRTPLTGMAWMTEALLSGSRGMLSEAQQELVERGSSAIQGMIRLVNDLLDVTRVEEGRFGIKTEEQDVVPIIRQVVEALKKDAERKRISLVLRSAERIPRVRVDASKMQFVFNNLIDNAVQYTPEGGRVEVAVGAEGKGVRISVRDTGIGIPREERDRVFTKFYRSRKASSLHTDGTGLGLYVAKNIVEQHGGRIAFESEEGEGTTFIVSLPGA